LLHDAPDPTIDSWLQKLIAVFIPAANKLDELPTRAGFIYGFDPTDAKSAPDNAEVLQLEKTPAVLELFATKIKAEPEPISAERFKAIINDVKTETGAKGKELFHPIRITITGSHSGPEFDKVIPVIEEGSALPLPKRIPSVKERVAAYMRS
jgi:nondiscriminating glutamyl-tRNA synthetase